ncbi:Cell division protein ZapA [Salinivirga cyanobacteriivorans]|uniref:Cell division protein ZapA n=1 Tax=Salinivirga cyanobacteriivorans TaxID=1307839 RepID=A0A0S2HYZ1_9BACT|nr:cell division protein ZapA [Salinivirga cyanobacteriivorans]ALO15259.1 Cell division protein ZapA [Salinivirga cyanobacteriivorans]
MSELSDTFTIRVNIADRYYPLKIKRTDEAKVRNAATKINETVFQYRKVYSDKDAQDFLAMAALQFATKLTDIDDEKSGNAYQEFLQDISQKLDSALKKQ